MTNPQLLDDGFSLTSSNKEYSQDTTAPITSSVPAVKQNPEARPACFASTIQECLFITTATLCMASSSFLYGTCTVITSEIGRALHMTPAEITWITASSSLTAGSFLLFSAKISDTFDRRILLIGSLGAFSVFSLVAGFATNPMYLNILTGVLGLCTAGTVPPAMSTLGVAYAKPSRRKNAAFAVFASGAPLGAVMGTIFSGIAAQIFSWRASFYLLSIIFALFFILSIFSTPKLETKSQPLSWDTLKKQFDVVGILMCTSGIALFSAALSLSSDAPQGWKTPYVIVMIVLGVLLFGSFLFWEGHHKYPVMPLHIWKDKNFTLIILVMLFGYGSFGTGVFWISLYMQNVLGYSPLTVAVHLIPQAVTGVIANAFAGLVLHRINNKVLMGISSVSYLAAALLLSLMKGDNVYWAFIFPALILAVIGADLQFNIANMFVMSSLPPERQGLGGGILSTVIKLSITMGLAISSSVYTAQSSGEVVFETTDKPYHAAFWVCTAAAALGVCIFPFVTIGTQGNVEKDVEK